LYALSKIKGILISSMYSSKSDYQQSHTF